MPGTSPGMTAYVVRGFAYGILSQSASQRLEILDQRLAIIRLQILPDDTLHRLVLVVFLPKLVAGVRVAADRGIEFKTVGEVIGLVAEIDGVVFAVAEIERLGPLLDRGQQRVDARDRGIVEIG